MTKKYIVEYDSNNSGGSWWLEDEDWYELEKAGWKINWVKDSRSKKYFLSSDGRMYLGALATEAFFEVEALNEDDALEKAIKSFEGITGQDAEDEGCPCCGRPHNFNIKD